MVTLEEVLVTSVRLLGGAEGAVGREGKGVSHLQSVADPESRHRKGICPPQPHAEHGNFECSSILT